MSIYSEKKDLLAKKSYFFLSLNHDKKDHRELFQSL